MDLVLTAAAAEGGAAMAALEEVRAEAAAAVYLPVAAETVPEVKAAVVAVVLAVLGRLQLARLAGTGAGLMAVLEGNIQAPPSTSFLKTGKALTGRFWILPIAR
jgi:hypothetical protein